jgi:hypothetical protein
MESRFMFGRDALVVFNGALPSVDACKTYGSVLGEDFNHRAGRKSFK